MATDQYGCEIKTKSPYGWIRAKDCAYAEKLGWTWRKLPSPKKDFQDRAFTHVLTRTKDNFGGVLEPDTRVPNFSTSWFEAVALAIKLGLDIEQDRARIMRRIDTALMGDDEISDMLD